jgi:hypothetical protein
VRLLFVQIEGRARGDRLAQNHIFMQNLIIIGGSDAGIMAALRAQELSPETAIALGPKLKRWLEEVPYYDPEGWSLTSIPVFLPCCSPD